MKNGKRDYERENRLYNSRPLMKKRRAKRNAARQAMQEMGLVRKGDGKDVDHRTPLSRGGANSRSNLRVVDDNANRSFARTRRGAIASKGRYKR